MLSSTRTRHVTSRACIALVAASFGGSDAAGATSPISGYLAFERVTLSIRNLWLGKALLVSCRPSAMGWSYLQSFRCLRSTPAVHSPKHWTCSTRIPTYGPDWQAPAQEPTSGGAG